MHYCGVAILFVIAFVHSGTALSCYECDPQQHDCADPFTDGHLTPVLCPETLGQSAHANANANAGGYGPGGQHDAPKGKSNALCYKAVVKASDEHYQIYRGCGLKSEKETCENLKNSLQVKEFYACKTCTGEHCNSAPRHLSITLSLLLLAPLMVLINKF